MGSYTQEEFQCENCEKVYKHKQNLRKHQRYQCGDKWPFGCSFCDFRTKHKCSLQLHMKKHPEAHVRALTRRLPVTDGKYKCPSCKKAYKHKFILNRHIRYECGNLRPFACTMCPYSAKQKNTLKAHMFNKHNSVVEDKDVNPTVTLNESFMRVFMM
ncbi:zinc finger E-box-binding homeobox protein zag-1-like [Macrosteles quadrilineatus]|uniref:zinc finger E-box-binding homeobox protein zag-1-like n=1 Tax=Macrosteles quadrilineatus TaxID=74068 RepID=UPI0023E19BBD|nr:zinc finger E-box-binding homeobox protein zag-1-like [Macrosteles quadrilineatus]